MPELPPLPDSTQILNQLTLPLIVFICLLSALIILALITIVAALMQRFRNIKERIIWNGYESRWTPIVLDILNGDLPPDTIHRHVHGKNEVHYFIDYMMRYRNQIKGPDVKLIEDMVAPFHEKVSLCQ